MSVKLILAAMEADVMTRLMATSVIVQMDIQVCRYAKNTFRDLSHKKYVQSHFYCATIAYHVGLNALLVAARHHDQRLRKKDIYTWP